MSSDPKTLGLLFESLVLHDLKVYAAVSDATVSHYHDADDLEVDAIVHRRDGSWVAVGQAWGPPSPRGSGKSASTRAKAGRSRGEAACGETHRHRVWYAGLRN